MMKHLTVGDKVKYSRNFLRSVGALTGELPFVQGVITSLEDFGGERKLATIVWSSPEIPRKVLDCNLVQVVDIEQV